MSRTLPIPDFYNPERASDWNHRADPMMLAEAAWRWKQAHEIRPSQRDEYNIHVVLIDVQKDFCLPTGALYVGGRSGTGAIDDSRRIAEFLYRNAANVTHVTTTLDTHQAYQIFFPAFWVDGDGQFLSAHRVISVDEIACGDVRPNPAVAAWLCNGDYAWLCKQVRYYCEELEKAGKYQLYLWPPHCLLGSDGHALVGVIHEAHLFHSFLRSSQNWIESKGDNPLTENYSVLRPEVLSRHDGAPLAQRNTHFLERLLSSDAVVIAGQAASHCVKSTIDDLLDEIVALDAALARKVYILTDCMSSVTVPDGKGGFLADFTDQAENAMKRFEAAGMHLVRSTESMASWPDIRL